MFRLTRQVRFSVDAAADQPPGHKPANNYAGDPPLTGLGHFFCLSVMLGGPLDEHNGCLVNIKQIDAQARRIALPLVRQAIAAGGQGGAAAGPLAMQMFLTLRHAWPGTSLRSIRLDLTPFLSYSVLATEVPMVRLSQKFEFCASHRLHNPALSDEENRQTFGKCNNPHGHGHNYELQVTLAGPCGSNGTVMEIPAFEKIVASTVLDHLDHKNLNQEVPEFGQLIPTVENIAQVIYKLLKHKFHPPARLVSVTVWETTRTWCEYGEG